MDNLLSWVLFVAFFLVMMRFGCGSHMSHGGHRHHESRRNGTDSPSKDPVCGMEVGPDSGYSRTTEGREYRFCSKKCLDEFEAGTNRYAA